ncbi:MAG: hypothetical protein PHN74_00715 [Candidatus Pacebacteria bacterium]|nr:hypothetical protein [Candidatus Paceibacterota bacterium]
MNNIKKTFISLSVLLAASICLAAEIKISGNSEIKIGSQSEININIDTQYQNINAVEGNIIFPDSVLKLKEIKTGLSIINFWVEQPKISSSGNIRFSGIIPGGYQGNGSNILSLIFEAKELGMASSVQRIIKIENLKILLNDGKGTLAEAKTNDFRFSISKNTTDIQNTDLENNLHKDIASPELFEPVLSKNQNIFAGKYFLVFTTQDKGSGIDHYEVKEGEEDFVVAETPYLIKDQNLKSRIFVKAIDKEGNEITVEYSPKKLWYLNYWLYIIIIIGIVGAVFITKKSHKK